VTLKDFFDRASEGSFTFEARQWFNDGQFSDDADHVYDMVPLHVRRDMSFFDLVELPAVHPFISVHSPVDVVVFGGDGKRYVSSAALANPGDVVLEKLFADAPGLMNEENADDGISFGNGEFPEYNLALPSSFAGKGLRLELHGIGAGSYRIDLNTGSDSLLALGSLSGNIALGETILGEINVAVVPEPSSTAQLLAGLLIAAIFVRRRHRLSM